MYLCNILKTTELYTLNKLANYMVCEYLNKVIKNEIHKQKNKALSMSIDKYLYFLLDVYSNLYKVFIRKVLSFMIMITSLLKGRLNRNLRL